MFFLLFLVLSVGVAQGNLCSTPSEETYTLAGVEHGDIAGRGVAATPDGGVVVVGNVYPTRSSVSSVLFLRYRSDGKLAFDPVVESFKDKHLPRESSAGAVTMDGDVAVVVGFVFGTGTDPMHKNLRTYYNYNFLMLRFQGSKVVASTVTDFSGGDNNAMAVAMQNGKAVACGYATNKAGADFALVRYLSTGQLDPNFGTGGKVVHDFFGNVDECNAVVIDSAARIVAAGFTTTSDGKEKFAVARFLSDGALDVKFGDAGGRATLDFGGLDQAKAAALDSQGRVVVVGQTFSPDTVTTTLAIARLTTDGLQDSSFQFTPPSGSTSTVGQAVVVLPGDDVVVGGYSYANGFTFDLFQYGVAGDLVAHAHNAIGTSSAKVFGLALDVAGALVAVGSAAAHLRPVIPVVKYLTGCN